ncbi:hypothetical protein BVY03_03725 [bacterium K02(2017)]|nr:hypothetical protein BVY03_03725 [bacterium K02(2017)]
MIIGLRMTNDGSNIAAFFDLDKTLIEGNSGWIWAKYEKRLGNISNSQLLRVAFWNILYHLSIIDMETAYSYAVEQYKNCSDKDLFDRTEKWFESDVKHLYRPQAQAAKLKHEQLGHKIVLLTSSSRYVAGTVAKHFGFKHWIANQFPLDKEGKIIGTFKRPLCYGTGKIHYAKEWAKKHDVSIENSFFYSDSYSDLPFLKEVGHPKVVTPDPRLKKVAKKMTWPILDWSLQ